MAEVVHITCEAALTKHTLAPPLILNCCLGDASCHIAGILSTSFHDGRLNPVFLTSLVTQNLETFGICKLKAVLLVLARVNCLHPVPLPVLPFLLTWLTPAFLLQSQPAIAVLCSHLEHLTCPS